MAQENFFDRYDEATPEQVKQAAQTAGTQASTQRTQALTPADVRLREAQAAAQEAKNKADEAKRDAAAKAAKNKATSTQERVNVVLRKLAEARRLVSRWSTGWGSYLSGIPETDAREIKSLIGPEGTVGAQVLLRAMEELRASSASGATGLGAMDRNENTTLKNSITNLDLGNDPETVLNAINDLDRSFRRYAAITSGANPDDREVAVQFGLVPPEDQQQEGGPPPRIGGTTAEENVDRPSHLRGLNATVSRMLREGRSAADIKAYLNKVEPGLGEKTINLDWWETEMKKPEEQRAAPEAYINVEEIRTQASAPEKFLGAAAQTRPGTAAIGAADFITGGLLPQFTGNPEGTRAAIKGAEMERPGSFLAGQIGGGVIGGAGLQRLAARYGLELGPATISALQSGLYGFGTSEEEGLGAVPDALSSAMLGYVGGKGGEYIGRGLGKVAEGVKDTAVTALRNRGVPLTVGEILGPRARALEARMSNLPLIGPAISARLDEGTDAFNRAAFSEALADLGQKYQDYGPDIGSRAVRKARQNVSQAFKDALGGVNLVQDDVFQRNVSNTWTELGQLPDVGPKLLRALNDQLGELLQPGRPLTGTEVQAALRKIDKIGRSFKNNELYESSIAPRLSTVSDEIRGVVERQAPDVLPQYDAARGAWRKVSVLGDAVKRSTKGETAETRGVFTPEDLQAAGIANAEKFTGKGSSVTRSYPFEQLAETGIDVMTPRGRSGSAYTLPLTAAGLVGGANYFSQPGQETNPQTGAVTGEPRDPLVSALFGLGAAGLAATPYSKYGQKAISNLMMAPRNPVMERLGALTAKYAPTVMGGGAGAYFGGAPTRGTPEMESPPPVSFRPVNITPREVAAEEPAPQVDGLGVMPSAFAGAQIDPETNDVVLPDGTRIPLSTLAGAQ